MDYYLVTYQHSDGMQRKRSVFAQDAQDAKMRVQSDGYRVLAVQVHGSINNLGSITKKKRL